MKGDYDNRKFGVNKEKKVKNRIKLSLNTNKKEYWAHTLFYDYFVAGLHQNDVWELACVQQILILTFYCSTELRQFGISYTLSSICKKNVLLS